MSESAGTFPQTREEFDAYKARLEAAGFTVLTRWRKGLKTIRLGEVVLSEDVPPAVTDVVVQPPQARLEATPVSEEDDPFDCDECPEDSRPHLHCPWGGTHKHYADGSRT